MKKIWWLIIFLSVQVASAARLSPIESQIRDAVTQQTPNQISFLEKLVNVNSGTTNIAGIIKIGEMLRPEFAQLGFKTYWVAEPLNMHKAPTLVAEKVGTQGKRLLLIAHLDTVFAPDSSFQKMAFKQHTATGPGALDDKGGIVVILYALRAMQAAHALENTNITVILTGDEEESGKPTSISRRPLFAAAKHSDVALDFELAVTLNTATIARRGIASWFVRSQGNESHSATIFQPGVGNGAIFEMARILNTLRRKSLNKKYVTFNPGIIAGGTSVTNQSNSAEMTVFGKTNVIAKVAAVHGDYRFLTLAQKRHFEQQLNYIVKHPLPGTKSAVTFQDGIPGMAPTAGNLALLNIYSRASQDLSFGKIYPFASGLRGAGDISHIATIVPQNLAGLGPVGNNSHSISESIELNSLGLQTKRAAILIYRLTR